MPSPNVVRELIAGDYYHVYNRGVNKANLFHDDRDYKVFLYYLKTFLSPPDTLDVEEPFYDPRRTNYHKRLSLIAYCLMPNHFHLFVQQIDDIGLPEMMRSLANAYTKYFNRRYGRLGPLFQGRYKAARVGDDAYFMHLSRYIHANPKALKIELAKYQFSSYEYFINQSLERPIWLNPAPVLELFEKSADYRHFVEDEENDSVHFLGSAAID